MKRVLSVLLILSFLASMTAVVYGRSESVPSYIEEGVTSSR
ncbi:hypothetical protein [Halalkalibacter akibai]|nr:hypothetical protein [Halalkalibacter akibai]